MVKMIHELTILHFKDLKRSLYGEGNYRLCGRYRRYETKSSNWRSLSRDQQQKRFDVFLKNKKFVEEEKEVKSSWSNFKVPKTNTARKPNQRKRVRSCKTKTMKN